MTVIINIGIVLTAYVLGSIPFGLIFSRYAGVGDIRNIGSGNIGATNVMRTGKKSLAILTLLCDGGKGAVAVAIPIFFGNPDWVILCSGVAVVFGHIFPVWLGFKGGKGVATGLAVLLVAKFPIGIIAIIAWIAIFLCLRVSSMASILAFICSGIFSYFLLNFSFFLMHLVITVLIIYRHKDNINRILKGEELDFSNKGH